jgi:ABC-2 type transport system ATP-binding protein
MIIETDALRREFLVGTRLRRRRVTAVEDVTIDIARGEAVGFLGPNGAGKSTTIKMLTGVLVPTSGRATVCGLDPVRERRELARRIGVVFGQRSQLWWDLPLADSFDLHAAIHRVPAAQHRQRLAECVELLDMSAFLTTPVRQLSLGQRMRGEVTAALLHAPELLVLDEPTIGLDLASKERLRSFLSSVNARGDMTLLLTTHDLPDVERLCRRVVVIGCDPTEPRGSLARSSRVRQEGGKVLVDDELAVLRRRFAGNRALVVELTEPAPPLLGLPGVVDVTVEAQGLRQRLEFTAGTTTAAELIATVAQRVELRDVSVDEPSIEDLVRTLYAR